MSETFWIACIVAITGMASPLLLALLTNRNHRKDKERDYARQDAVAAKVKETAALLLASNQKVDGKLNVIHGLVNSNMTAAMQAELGATMRELVALLEIQDLKRSAGIEPGEEAMAVITLTKDKIAELKAALADRGATSPAPG